MSLVNELKAYRLSKSVLENTPVYCVFGDTVLNAIAREKPRDIMDLSRIRGFTTEKCAKYGIEILSMVNSNSSVDIVVPRISLKASKEEIYILELAMGRVYVGRTSNLWARISAHQKGVGSIFTKFYTPTGRLLPRLGDVRGSGDCAGFYYFIFF